VNAVVESIRGGCYRKRRTSHELLEAAADTEPIRGASAYRAEQTVGGNEPPQRQTAECDGGAEYYGEQIFRQFAPD
jgi:hypothetical protein